MPNNEITPEMLRQIMPNLPAAKRSKYLPLLSAAMIEFGITTELRAAAFLAQLAHESAEFRYMEEIASGKAYEGRRDLGNTHPGDGQRYKGRGPIQLTGRSNYRKYGTILGLDLEANPEQAATPEVGFRIAGCYWDINGLNKYADKRQFRAISGIINAGRPDAKKINGLPDRIKYYERALRVLPDDLNLDGADKPIDEDYSDLESSDQESEDKGVTTIGVSDTKKEDVGGVPPPAPAVNIQASRPSLWSKVTSFSYPAGAGGIVIGLKTFMTGIPTWGWAVIGVCFVILCIVGAWLYNESMKRAAGRTQTLMNSAADQQKNNLRLI